MTCHPTLTAALVVFLLAGLAVGQYNSDFEALSVTSMSGTPLTDPLSAATGFPIGTPCASLPPANQDCYYVPAGTTSVVWNAYPYSGNSLGIPQNPAGGAQFIAGIGPGGTIYARAQRDLTFSVDTWTIGFDICVTFGGVLPTVQNVGSVSLQPTTAALGQSLIALAMWTDPNTATTWDVAYRSFDATGAAITAPVSNPAFLGLPINTWYRWETDVDFATNLVVGVRLTDIAAGTTVIHCPSGLYLSDLTPSQGLPQAFRFFAGGGTAGNTLAIDNASIVTTTVTAEFQVNQPGSSLDLNFATNPPCAPIKVSAAVGEFVTFHLASTASGLPWDLGLTAPEPSVPLSGAGIGFGGQILNLDVTAPSFSMLLNLNFNLPFVPLSIPFASPVPFGLTTQMVNLDPTAPAGIALSAPNELTILPCPSSANFDNLTPGVGVYPVGWSNGGGIAEWSVGTGVTTSGSTGPLTGAFSPPNYIYCETSAPLSATFIMDTCLLDVLQLQNFTLDFRLSRLGATIGTLNVWQDDASGTFTNLLGTYTGAEPAGLDWTPESLPIVIPATGSTARFRFEYIATSGFTGDLALDDILLW